MEDLIRRSDAIAILEDLQSKHLQFCLVPFRLAIEKMQAVPSADRPQGKWIYCEDYVGRDGYKCSECGFFVPWCYDVYADSNFIRHYHTCPHCDSRMKGADDE